LRSGLAKVKFLSLCGHAEHPSGLEKTIESLAAINRLNAPKPTVPLKELALRR
jgi:hypothetical protein